jgi:hypothetical protein
LGETGSQHSTPLGDRGDWFRDGAAWIESNQDARDYFKGFCYYHVDNHDSSGHWWRFVGPNTEFVNDGKQGYIDGFVSNPYFKTVPIDVITENEATSSIQVVGITTGFKPGNPIVTMTGGAQIIRNVGGVASPTDYDQVEEEAGAGFGTPTVTMGDPPNLISPTGIASEEAFGAPVISKHTGQGWIFIPPIRYNNPSTLPTTSQYKRALFKFFRGPPVGHNVYVLHDGTVTESANTLDIAKTYLGGHTHVVTDEEADVLWDAGYVDNLSIIL